MVDLLAPEGVAVNVDQEIIDDMSIQASVGKNVLHGEEILKYVRFRHDDESDFGRVERQQEVMVQIKTAFINQISSFEGMAALPSIIEQGLSSYGYRYWTENNNGNGSKSRLPYTGHRRNLKGSSGRKL